MALSSTYYKCAPSQKETVPLFSAAKATDSLVCGWLPVTSPPIEAMCIHKDGYIQIKFDCEVGYAWCPVDVMMKVAKPVLTDRVSWTDH
eukprot:m.264844 g.264844  ORF g.264844 m.264844 type:complete len:89 (-) comp58467_c0_seq1:183-449(-)